jgi:hypothetical protein
MEFSKFSNCEDSLAVAYLQHVDSLIFRSKHMRKESFTKGMLSVLHTRNGYLGRYNLWLPYKHLRVFTLVREKRSVLEITLFKGLILHGFTPSLTMIGSDNHVFLRLLTQEF